MIQLKLYFEVSVLTGLPLQNTVALAVVWNTLGVSPPWPLLYGVVISVLWGFQGRHCSRSHLRFLLLLCFLQTLFFIDSLCLSQFVSIPAISSPLHVCPLPLQLPKIIK